MNRPDTETRILVATIALIVVLAWVNGGIGIWDHAKGVLP